MKMNAYLHFDGTCAVAFKRYAQYLGGTIEAMFPYGEMPGAEQLSPEQRERIMHARLAVGDQVLMGSDCLPPEHPYEGSNGFSVSLNVDTPTEAERIFAALAEHGTVVMPIDQTFFSARFGMLTDQFGVHWMVNCEQAA